MVEEATEIVVSPEDVFKKVGELKKELPKGTKTLMFLCVKCGTYTYRENVTVGDEVFEVNLAVICKCGNTFLLAIKGVA